MSRITDIAKTMKTWRNEDDDPFVHRALDEIIRIDQEQASNRRMSEDLIRRSDAIKALDANFTIKGKENMQTVLNYLELVRTRIEGAPTIEPKRGEWKGGDVLTNCSICGEAWDLKYLGGQEMWYTGELPNFCPNCGCRMKGADDE